MKNENEVTVLIIDEHTGISPLLAERLGLIPGIRVIGETANVMLGAELAHQFEPHVILADVRRTGPPRAETYRWLARVSPASRLWHTPVTLPTVMNAPFVKRECRAAS